MERIAQCQTFSNYVNKTPHPVLRCLGNYMYGGPNQSKSHFNVTFFLHVSLKRDIRMWECCKNWVQLEAPRICEM